MENELYPYRVVRHTLRNGTARYFIQTVYRQATWTCIGTFYEKLEGAKAEARRLAMLNVVEEEVVAT